MMLKNIGQISINAHDLPRATAFYRDVLELPYLFGAGNMAFFDCGGVRLMLALPEKPEFDHPSSILYFRVDDLERTHALLVERGVKFESIPTLVAKMPTYDLWMAFLRDSEGNTLSLMSEVKRAE